MKPRQIGNMNTGKSAFLFALVCVLSPVAVVKAMLSKPER